MKNKKNKKQKKERKIIVLSLGGSIIVPDKIDVNFLKKFRKTIISLLPKYKFIIVCGGGKVCRDYISAAKNIKKLNDEVYDVLGIKLTEANAQLILSILYDVSHKEIHPNYNKEIKFENVLIGCGFLPGTSTDYDAVMFAKNHNSDTVINLSNIESVYDKDPKKYKNTKKIKKISWKNFRKLVGNKWKAGLNLPFDPVASKKCEQLGIKVAIMDGRNLDNFKNYLERKEFKGTLIN